LESFFSSLPFVRLQLLVEMIRYGCAVASRRPALDAKSNGATVADQYDHRRYRFDFQLAGCRAFLHLDKKI